MLEFAAVELEIEGFYETSSYSTYLRPPDGVRISRRTVEINGITSDSVRNAPSFGEVADTIYELMDVEIPLPSCSMCLLSVLVWAPGKVWAGHNISRFDNARIREAFNGLGRAPPVPAGVVDTYDLLRREFGTRAGNMKVRVWRGIRHGGGLSQGLPILLSSDHILAMILGALPLFWLVCLFPSPPAFIPTDGIAGSLLWPGHASAQVGPGHASAQVGPGHASAQVGPGHASAQVGPGHASAQVGPGHASAQGFAFGHGSAVRLPSSPLLPIPPLFPLSLPSFPPLPPASVPDRFAFDEATGRPVVLRPSRPLLPSQPPSYVPPTSVSDRFAFDEATGRPVVLRPSRPLLPSQPPSYVPPTSVSDRFAFDEATGRPSFSLLLAISPAAAAAITACFDALLACVGSGKGAAAARGEERRVEGAGEEESGGGCGEEVRSPFVAAWEEEDGTRVIRVKLAADGVRGDADWRTKFFSCAAPLATALNPAIVSTSSPTDTSTYDSYQQSPAQQNLHLPSDPQQLHLPVDPHTVAAALPAGATVDAAFLVDSYCVNGTRGLRFVADVIVVRG
ncbi:unnamed protein product [Closterium sp. Yama58-4]|nr:unnamed protein product [Closterium sp. Yama58-4]